MSATDPNEPWLEMRPCEGGTEGSLTSTDLPEAAKAGESFQQAIFAASVLPLEWNKRVTYKWGFSPAFLLEEAIERQLLFIEQQHPGDDLALDSPVSRRSLALRAVIDPQAGLLSLAILGKARAATACQAGEAAHALWQELKSIFPYDYRLIPADQKAYQAISGLDVLQNAKAVQEIRRFEGLLTTEDGRFYILGRWQASNWANEQIWRALMGVSAPTVFNVFIRPAVLFDYERIALAEMEHGLKKAAGHSLPEVYTNAQWAAGLHTRRQSEWRYPYLVQVHMASTQPLPEFLGRAIGTAFTHAPYSANSPDVAPGFEAVGLTEGDATDLALKNIAMLEPVITPAVCSDMRLQRMRWLMGAREALAAFRWPYPPENGLPGVVFYTPD
jgi:hypothetical protein